MAGSYIPAMDWSPLSQLGQTITTNLQAGQKQELLSQLGKQFGSGDIKGAAQTALAGGDMKTAMSLFTLGQQQEADKQAQSYLTPAPTAASPAQAAPSDVSAPRGLRNGNPGNIEDGGFAKSQPGYAGSDGRFARFDTLENGVRAQSNLLASYGQKGVNTVSGIVGRWAPSAENGAATGNYAAFVAKKLGVGPNDPLDMNNPNVRQQIASAMGEFENGRPVRVADASGAVPASAGAPQGGGDATAALVARRDNYLRAAATPHLSAERRKQFEMEAENLKWQIDRADKQAKDASPAAVQEFQFARQNGYKGSFEEFKQIGRANTTVNVDTKSETEFAKASGAGISKRFQALSEEGDGARQDIALMGQLRDLGGVVQTGGMAAAQAWLADKGLKLGDNVGAVEAYSSIIDKLTPAQRVPGSGATSDYEAKLFKASLPKLINTPEGNAIIMQTLSAIAQSKIDRATIAEKALIGELKPGEAVKQLQALPSPYEAFKAVASGKAAPAAPTQQQTPQSAPKGDLKPAPAGLIAKAREMVAHGMDRADVVQRMREGGYDIGGF